MSKQEQPTSPPSETVTSPGPTPKPDLIEVRVGRIGKPHGLDGLCTVQLFTDDPHKRFAPGALLLTEPEHLGPLTVTSATTHNQRWVLGFAQITSREQAQQWRNTILKLVVDPQELPNDPNEFYDHQLVGCVCFIGETAVGCVQEVLHGGAQDLLVVASDSGTQTLVPFVAVLVPQVDVFARRILLTPPAGMFAEFGES